MTQPSTPAPSPNACSASCVLSLPTPSLENTPDASGGDSVFLSSSPLYTSLLSCMESPNVADAEMLMSIPISSNPHPMHTVFNDGADYWVGADDNLHLKDRYNKSGEYFNLPETGLDLGDIKNAKIQFKVLPLDDKEKDCPASAIGCSQFAMKLLFALHSEVEEARNACVPDMKTATTPRLSRAEAVSQARVTAKKYTQALGDNEGKKSNGAFYVMVSRHLSYKVLIVHMLGRWWRICNLKDSKRHYSALLNTYDLHGTRVQSPNVRDKHGVRIHVSDYKTKLKEGAIVELEVILKLWTIKPCNNPSNPRDAQGSRVYQIMLQYMQLLPCAKYMQSIFVDSLSARKGKRRAVDEAVNQSPTKKGSFATTLEDDESKYTMIE
ncbi:hypothetical protein BDR03DRAFT_979950 [Suillus americanus]|nr:hypothetical protein BDR03DRAFT_979950 [Suillus americanus]